MKLFSSVSPFLVPDHQPNVSITKELTREEDLALLFIEIFVSHTKIPIIEGISKNNRIKPIFLQQFFIKFIEKFMLKLED